ncbi:2Fe-2S iron-sulfur cluster-binding protein [Algiphilus sp.]|uniref:2Fe-2S iron-sulfur cluster-binding protein n=1 Tax=Algiphilus sp. TaxID=1872431 RepID=UPI003B52E5BF
MPQLHFLTPDGVTHTVEATVGQSVMAAATAAQVPGIVGECGGCCSCATCHVYIDAPWFEALGPLDEMETLMLEGAVEPLAHSRLCCQIEVTEDLDGMMLRIPAGQL